MSTWKRIAGRFEARRVIIPDERGNVTLTLAEVEGLLRLAGYEQVHDG